VENIHEKVNQYPRNLLHNKQRHLVVTLENVFKTCEKGTIFKLIKAVWKFQDFSVIQILRQISVEGFRDSKTAVIVFLLLWNLLLWKNFSLQKVQFMKTKFQSL